MLNENETANSCSKNTMSVMFYSLMKMNCGQAKSEHKCVTVLFLFFYQSNLCSVTLHLRDVGFCTVQGQSNV